MLLMKILSYNIRGLGSSGKVREVGDLIRKKKNRVLHITGDQKRSH